MDRKTPEGLVGRIMSATKQMAKQASRRKSVLFADEEGSRPALVKGE